MMKVSINWHSGDKKNLFISIGVSYQYVGESQLFPDYGGSKHFVTIDLAILSFHTMW